MSRDNFSIVGLARDASSLTILESMLIAKYKLDLNVQTRSVIYCAIHRLYICNHNLSLGLTALCVIISLLLFRIFSDILSLRMSTVRLESFNREDK